MNEFSTRHFGLAATLRFVLGDGAHLRTFDSGRGCEFVFRDDDGTARQWMWAFMSAEGLALSDARALLECAKDLRETVAIARKQGTWTSV